MTLKELRALAQEQHAKIKALRSEIETKSADGGDWHDNAERVSEAEQELDKRYDACSETLDRIKSVEKQADVEGLMNRAADRHGIVVTAPASAMQLAEKALDQMNNSEDPVPLHLLAKGEREAVGVILKRAMNKLLHQSIGKGLTMSAATAKLTEVETKALSTFSDADGGVAVIEEMRSEVITKTRDLLYFRGRARVFGISGDTLAFPTLETAEALAKVGQNEKVTPKTLSDITGKVRFVLNKFMDIYKVPVELIEDQFFDLVSMIVDSITMDWAEQEEGLFINGTGANEPLGLLQTPGIAEVNATGTGGGADLDSDDLYSVIYNLRAVERANGSWLMSRAAIKAARTLKDGNGRYHWQDGIQAGQPAQLVGYPVAESEFYPDNVTSGNVGDPIMTFGNYGWYWIVEKQGGMTIETLRELYAEDDQIGYKYRSRIDGAAVKVSPFTTLVRVA